MPDAAEARYPKPSTEVRSIIFGYPAVVAASFLAQARAEWWWWLLAFCGVGWLAATVSAFADIFRREGYHEAMRDAELNQPKL